MDNIPIGRFIGGVISPLFGAGKRSIVDILSVGAWAISTFIFRQRRGPYHFRSAQFRSGAFGCQRCTGGGILAFD